tara:strand:+ start:1277 stop:1531 length:255 start_codon:yes stop_codon:yes gene_type:complete
MDKLVELIKQHQIKVAFVGGMVAITSVYGSCQIDPAAVMGLKDEPVAEEAAPVEAEEAAAEEAAPAEEPSAPAEPAADDADVAE